MKILLKIFLGLGFVFIINMALSQSLSLHPCPEGIFISIDKYIPNKYESYTIERGVGELGEFIRLEELKLPSTKEQMETALKEAIELLSFSKHNLNIDELWKSLRDDDLSKNNYFLNLPPVKMAIGSGWLDQQLSQGQSYRYRLKKGDQIISESKAIIFPENINFPEIILDTVSKNDRQPLIRWYALNPGMVRDFDVFRTPFGSADYRMVSTTRSTGVRKDTLWMTMVDTTLESEGLFLYYIIPKDFYGNKGSSKIAVQVSNLTRQSLPIFTKLEAKGHDSSKSMIIKWKINRLERTRSLQLYRSTEYEGDYEMVAELSPEDSIYSDPIPVANENYFYYMTLNDIFGDSRKSARFFGLFKGHIIPAPPQLLKVEVVEGGVSIQWKVRGESVRGFYVMRGEGYKGAMDQISPFIPALNNDFNYIDSSSTLKGQSIYSYSVLAESDTYDKSAPSDTLFIRPNVATSISPPVELAAMLSDGSVKLVWSDHSRLETYLAGYHVWRKMEGEERFKLLNDSLLKNTQNYYVDSSLELESKYEYAISAVDFFGAESYMSPSKIVDLKGELYLKPEDFWALRSDKGIILKWALEGNKNLIGFKLYRSDENDIVKIWKTVDFGLREVLDPDIKTGQSRFYQIAALYKGDKESEMTLPVYVRY